MTCTLSNGIIVDVSKGMRKGKLCLEMLREISEKRKEDVARY